MVHMDEMGWDGWHMPTLVSYTTNNVGGCGGEAVA